MTLALHNMQSIASYAVYCVKCIVIIASGCVTSAGMHGLGLSGVRAVKLTAAAVGLGPQGARA